jgi:hypothetical protein
VTDGSSPQTKRCIACGGTYYLTFFGRRANIKGNIGLKRETRLHRNRCIGCEAGKERKDSIDRNLRRKAVATRRRHAEKLKAVEVIKNLSDLEELYGWALDRMIEDIKRVVVDGCPYCLLSVNVAELGFGNITLDIINPDKRPHYSTNVRWCCTRCNSEKQRVSSEVWGDRLSMREPVAPKPDARRSRSRSIWLLVCFSSTPQQS